MVSNQSKSVVLLLRIKDEELQPILESKKCKRRLRVFPIAS
jgi:hypothetical protein